MYRVAGEISTPRPSMQIILCRSRQLLMMKKLVKKTHKLRFLVAGVQACHSVNSVGNTCKQHVICFKLFIQYIFYKKNAGTMPFIKEENRLQPNKRGPRPGDQEDNSTHQGHAAPKQRLETWDPGRTSSLARTPKRLLS
jgi:hypothetical protein